MTNEEANALTPGTRVRHTEGFVGTVTGLCTACMSSCGFVMVRWDALPGMDDVHASLLSLLTPPDYADLVKAAFEGTGPA